MSEQPPYTGNAVENDAPGDPLDRLRGLAVAAPPNTFTRLRRRAALAQGARTLFESQVFGFWIVLDALLRLLLGAPRRSPAPVIATEEKA